MKSNQTMKAAAIQMEARVADIYYNISQAGDLAEEALKAGARIVALPEFFTTQIVLDDRLFSASLNKKNNPALEMLKNLSSRYEATIGGSYLEHDELSGDVFNTYTLIEPNGTVHRHKKDIPTMAENAFYLGGSDAGLLNTEHAAIGAAVCWETIRSATVKRLAGKCDLLMTGSHWWGSPGWPILKKRQRSGDQLNTDHMFRAPGRFARLIGAPNLHAAHTGMINGRYALTPSLSTKFNSQLQGETQITDAMGNILARRKACEGPGVIFADITIGRIPPAPLPKGFWLESLPLDLRLIWQQQNRVCKKIYARAKRNGEIKPFID
ncbi:MAG: carbon-nitrogen hydrolase family protein [Moraxellaceae bacterium]|nr:carbon-nitrogen hydrolase family protein [Moraxellaceae bacterium]